MAVSNTYEGHQQLKIAGVHTIAMFRRLDCKIDGETYSLFDKSGAQVFSGPRDAAINYINNYIGK